VYVTQPPEQRLPAAIASLGTVALIGWALLSGLTVSNVVNAVAPLVSIEFTNPPPRTPEPPRPKPKAVGRATARNAPSPPNQRNKATPVVAPVLLTILSPPPIIAAPRPGSGEAANNGASDRSGPGQGAGGKGDGTGGGGNGGSGFGDKPPEQISGDLRFSDLSPELASSGGASMEVRYYVNVNGRASGCRVTTSSGNAAMDAVGCQIVEQRFRFRPSRDGEGQPIRSVMIQKLEWTIEGGRFERDRG
jgi:protein TonB